MKKKQLNEWVHQLVNESNVEVVKEIQLGEATVRLGKTTDANFHQAGGGLIVQLISNVGSVGLDKKDVRALLGYIKKMMGYSYMPRLKEAISKKKVDTKIIAQQMIKDKDGWFGKSWAKALLKKYPKGVSEHDLQMDLPDYITGSAISNLFVGLDEEIELGKVYTDKDRPPFQTNEQKLNERVVALPSGVKADLDTLKGLTIFTHKGKPIKFDRQQVAMFIRSVGKFMGIK